MSHTQITKLARLYQSDFEPQASFFQLLWEVVQKQLKLDDEHVLQIIQKRVIKGIVDTSSETLLQCDEAYSM